MHIAIAMNKQAQNYRAIISNIGYSIDPLVLVSDWYIGIFMH